MCSFFKIVQAAVFGTPVYILRVAHRALCAFGQLEVAADALHHLLFLVSSGEAAAATAAARTGPANKSLQPQGPAPVSPHSQAFGPTTTAQQSEDLSNFYETAGPSEPTAQTESGGQAEMSQQQAPDEAIRMVDNSCTASQPAAQQHIGADPASQLLLQHQPPTPVPSQPQEQPPSDPTIHDQQVTHQLKHSQQALVQQDRTRLPCQGSSQPGNSPAQLEEAAASQGSLLQGPQHSREATKHAELPYFQLKLIREACHTVMTLAEKRGQPALMLPLLESMQQVGSSPTLRDLKVEPQTLNGEHAIDRQKAYIAKIKKQAHSKISYPLAETCVRQRKRGIGGGGGSEMVVASVCVPTSAAAAAAVVTGVFCCLVLSQPRWSKAVAAMSVQ